jgi:hypothetical protein
LVVDNLGGVDQQKVLSSLFSKLPDSIQPHPAYQSPFQCLSFQQDASLGSPPRKGEKLVLK